MFLSTSWGAGMAALSAAALVCDLEKAMRSGSSERRVWTARGTANKPTVAAPVP